MQPGAYFVFTLLEVAEGKCAINTMGTTVREVSIAVGAWSSGFAPFYYNVEREQGSYSNLVMIGGVPQTNVLEALYTYKFVMLRS